MNIVKEYFDQLDIKFPGTPRNVFLAADDPEVFVEAHQNFTNYQFITNDKAANMVHLMENRNGQNYMAYTIADLEILARCDFVVLTHSSNYGRRVHEMKYNYFVDATERTVSVDKNYHIFVQKEMKYKILQRHVSRNPKVTLEVGNIVTVDRFWHIMINGLLKKVSYNNQTLNVPDYKLEKIFHPIDMPNYT
jgi:glycoprotein 6-alpha-L-fucosyltransferase